MEETMVNSMGLLSSYGALGVVAVYFMVKDWILNKQMKEALQEFTIAMKILSEKVD